MVTLKNITKNYMQGKLEVPVLKSIDLTVENGEYVAIMGPSGSGKTTLMNIIGLLDLPTEGTYFLDDEDMSHLTENQLSEVRNKKIGFVFQQFNLMPKESALSNVALPLVYAGVKRKEREERARVALEKIGLGDRIDFKQRVSIARAMVSNPKVRLADEPTGAPDTKAGFQVMELFQQLHDEGVTIIMITHEEEIAECAERIVSLRDGKIIDLRAGKGTVSAPEEVES